MLCRHVLLEDVIVVVMSIMRISVIGGHVHCAEAAAIEAAVNLGCWWLFFFSNIYIFFYL